MRTAEIIRKTAETDIRLTLNIDGTGKSKTDFALDLIYKCSDYCIPDYIKSGLKWLNDQRVLE